MFDDNQRFYKNLTGILQSEKMIPKQVMSPTNETVKQLLFGEKNKSVNHVNIQHLQIVYINRKYQDYVHVKGKYQGTMEKN